MDRINQFASYEEWANHVQKIELAEAQKRLAAGDDINLVLETMSIRIQKKMLHPVLIAIKQSHQTDYDPVQSRQAYEKAYGSRPRVADHIVDD